jgi:hypothetical protein
MRWYNKLRLVFRIYSRRMFVTLLLFGMCFVSFFMIDRVFTGYIGSRYAIRQTEKEFGVNTADAGYVHFVTRDIKQDLSELPAYNAYVPHMPPHTVFLFPLIPFSETVSQIQP